MDFLKGPFTASFSFIFVFYKQLLLNMFNKSCWWQDSNTGPLVSEATTLPIVPQSIDYFCHGNRQLKVYQESVRFICKLV